MDTITRFVQSIAFDIVGLGFAGVAGYGLISGRLTGSDQQTALMISALYLGVKLPSSPTAIDAGGITSPPASTAPTPPLG